MTLGLFLLVINAIIILLVDRFVSGFSVDGFWWALAFSLIMSIFNSIIDEGILKQLDWYQDLKRFEGSALTNNTVLIVDEAGMVGTRLWNELLVSVNQSGAIF
jgi:hypothetical protein